MESVRELKNQEVTERNESQNEENGNNQTQKELKEKFDQMVGVDYSSQNTLVQSKQFLQQSQHQEVGPDSATYCNQSLRITATPTKLTAEKAEHLIQVKKTGQKMFKWSDPFSSYAFVIDRYNEGYQYNDIDLEAPRPWCFYIAWWWLMTLPWEGCTMYCLCRLDCCRRLICYYYIFMWGVFYFVPFLNIVILVANVSMFCYFIYGYNYAQKNRQIVSDENIFSHQNIRRVAGIQNFSNTYVLFRHDAHQQEIAVDLESLDFTQSEQTWNFEQVTMIISQRFEDYYMSFRTWGSWKVHIVHIFLNLAMVIIWMIALGKSGSEDSK